MGKRFGKGFSYSIASAPANDYSNYYLNSECHMDKVKLDLYIVYDFKKILALPLVAKDEKYKQTVGNPIYSGQRMQEGGEIVIKRG